MDTTSVLSLMATFRSNRVGQICGSGKIEAIAILKNRRMNAAADELRSSCEKMGYIFKVRIVVFHHLHGRAEAYKKTHLLKQQRKNYINQANVNPLTVLVTWLITGNQGQN